MSEFKIEKGVPRREPIAPFPLDDMEIGDSFVVEIRDDRDRLTAGQRLFRYNKENPPKRFSMKKEDDRHVRIHRVEDVE